MTQSNAIMRYLARRLGYYGDTTSDLIYIDIFHDEAYDYRNTIISTAYTLGIAYETVFDEFESITVPRYLDAFENYLSNR